MKERENSIVGIFDSGVGGLSVWRELIKVLPGCRMIYFSDNAYSPYGPKSQSVIKSRALQITKFLTDQGADIVVVACNTATAAAIDYLREEFSSVPFVGMEPAIKPAALQSKSKVIGVLATKGTFAGRLYNATLRRYTGGVRVVEREGAGLVGIVESGEVNGKESIKLLKRYIKPMIRRGADHIVLGCTHYPFLSEQISKIAGDNITLVDPAPFVARQTLRVMQERNLLCNKEADCRLNTVFYSTGDPDNLKRVATSIVTTLDHNLFKRIVV